MLNPCLHLNLVSVHKLTSIIAYTVLTNNFLVSAIHLFGAFFIKDDFHIAYCTAETLVVEYVVYLGWVATGDQVWVSLLEPGVADTEIIGYGEFQEHQRDHSSHQLGKYISGWDLDNCIFQVVVETFHFRFTWGAFTERKMKTALPMISLSRVILSEMHWTSITLSSQFSASSMAAWAQKKNFNLQSLPVKVQTRVPLKLYSCTPQMSTCCLDSASTTLASLSIRVPKYQVTTLISVLVFFIFLVFLAFLVFLVFLVLVGG